MPGYQPTFQLLFAGEAIVIDSSVPWLKDPG
jgi:hypothetical protein